MSDFYYEVVSSVLHDKASVEAIFSRFAPFFDTLGGARALSAAGQPDPEAIFVLTGGTESMALGLVAPGKGARASLPVILIAHPQHNSLPAALEILARLRQDGRSGQVIMLRAADDKEAGRQLSSALALRRAIERMRTSRLGAIGEPSDWLVASSQDAETAASAWGATVVPIPLARLEQKIGELRDQEKASGNKPGEVAEGFFKRASTLREPTFGDLYKSDTIYRALKTIAREEKLDGLTLRCFDLVTKDASTGCFALSELADEGIDSGCEGDIPSILALRWMRLVSGKPGWMANPADIRFKTGSDSGTLLLAHCTVPRTLVGEYRVRSHFESGLGVAVSGDFAAGPVTLLRFGGKDLRQAWLAEGYLVESPAGEGLCRTQAIIEAKASDLRNLLAAPLGNHIVVGLGHWGAFAHQYFEIEGIGTVQAI